MRFGEHALIDQEPERVALVIGLAVDGGEMDLLGLSQGTNQEMEVFCCHLLWGRFVGFRVCESGACDLFL